MDSSSEEEYEHNEVRLFRKKEYRERINFFLYPEDFKMRFRLRPHEAELVLSYIGRDLKHKSNRNKALSPQQQLLIALHWLSNGAQYHGVSDMHGVGTSTVQRSVKRVVHFILQRMFNIIVSWPADCTRISQGFMQEGGFPMVCGAVDGSLINVLAPTTYEEQYIDRHGKHSINASMICGPDYVFYSVNARFPGSVHDARVLRSSNVADRFNRGYRPFPGAVILGDSAYGLSDWLIPPLRRNPECPVENRFNVAHKRTRRLVECSFGMLKNRFPCLQLLRVGSPEYAAQIIMACVVLHNIATKSDFPNLDLEVADNQRYDGGIQNTNGERKLIELLNFFR